MNYENDGTQNRHIAEQNNQRRLAKLEHSCSKEAIKRLKEVPYQLKYQQMVKEKEHGKE